MKEPSEKEPERVSQSFELQPTSESAGQLVNTTLPDTVWVEQSIHTRSKPPDYPDSITQRATPKDSEMGPPPSGC